MNELQDANNLNKLKRQRVLSHYSELVSTLVSKDLLRVRCHNMCHDVTDEERHRFKSLGEEDNGQIVPAMIQIKFPMYFDGVIDP